MTTKSANNPQYKENDGNLAKNHNGKKPSEQKNKPKS